MLKDIYVEHAWCANNKLTLLRNDNKEIPIDLTRKFTWYYNDAYDWQDNTGNNASELQDPDPTPSEPDPEVNPTDPDPQLETPNVYLVYVQLYNRAQGFVICPNTVEEGLNLTITVYPTGAYEIDTFIVNGVSTTQNPHIVYNVHSDITIEVTFRVKQTTNPDQPGLQTGRFPVATAVDLGLPSGTKWSSWNMGSSSPLDIHTDGEGYYCWGDGTGDITIQTSRDLPWAVDHNFQYPSSADIAGTKYDLATSKWGFGWVTPTAEDFEELFANCNVSQDNSTADNNGKKYPHIKITSRTNPNNYIYLPSAGAYNSNGELRGSESACWYWTSKSVGPGTAIAVNAVIGDPLSYDQSFMYKIPIRPVYRNGSSNSGSSQLQQTSQITQDGLAAYNSAVDLGLPSGNKWASYNIGATSSQQTGDYIAWGEIYPKNIYTLLNNKFYNPNNPQGLEMDVDGVISEGCLLPENDAAIQRWGGNWQMPTVLDFAELLNNCDKTKDDIGCRYTSRINGNSIYLPGGGFSSYDTDGESAVFLVGYCRYWTNEIDNYYMRYGQYALSLKGGGDGSDQISGHNRDVGMLIRPVWKNKE